MIVTVKQYEQKTSQAFTLAQITPIDPLILAQKNQQNDISITIFQYSNSQDERAGTDGNSR
jgi:hypothetical protein